MTDEPKRTILCVDDEQDIVDALFDTFSDIYSVRTATSGEEALKIFDEEDISLVISDQRMPGMEGTELLSKINEKKPICKKILLTGYSDINAAIDAINLGSVDKYYSKPWDDEELTKAVNSLLYLYKMDEFFEKMFKDAQNMKDAGTTAKKSSETFQKFLDNYQAGVCVVGDSDHIEYLNKKGLEIMKYKDLNGIKGKDFKGLFLIDETNKQGFLKKYMKSDMSFDSLDIKRADGSTDCVQASLTFTSGNGGDRICGIVFS